MVSSIVSGRQTLDGIEQALKEVSEKVDRLKTELAKANEEKAGLIAKRLAAFEDLAKFQVKLALVDGVIDEADRLSASVRSLLQARQKTVADLQHREADATAKRDALLAEQKTHHAEIERLEKRLDALGEKAKKLLSSQAAYRDHASRRDELQGMAAKASEKAEKAKREEELKGAPYREDPIFMYLWARKFGASEYEATGIIRYLDKWVARLISFTDARANFSMLTAIPQRLAEHAERLNAMLEDAQQAVDAMEAEKIHELAGANLISELHSAQEQRDKAVAALETLNAELIETGKQLKLYAEGLDPTLSEAVGTTADFLDGQSVDRLLAEARRTPDVDDDAFVERIVKFAQELQRLERDMKARRENLDDAFARKEELLRIAAEFRRARYDAPGSVFEPGTGGEALLKMLLQGAINAAEYWARTRGNQRWRSRPGDSYRRSKSFPMGGGSRKGSSGPDFRTGGGF